MSLRNEEINNLFQLSGWGGFPVIDAFKRKPSSLYELRNLLKNGAAIPRGNGRSYGDSAINRKNTIDMTGFNRFLEFDYSNGLLSVQSGTLLSDIIDIFLPKGWFPYVTPGTKFVSIGGMVAADVHGKNHVNYGSFSNHVEWIEILNSDGEIIRCSRNKNSDLFMSTFGGMGLTGIILNIAFYMRPVNTAWISQKQLPARNLKKTMDIIESNLDSTYIAAWIDCLSNGENLGRSIIYIGEHSEIYDLEHHAKENPLRIKRPKKISIPFHFPTILLKKFFIKIFNSFLYKKSLISKTRKIVEWDNYFYPLDKILNWNRVYGKKGFAQFQCVLPIENSYKGLKEILDAISKSEASSFLGVLKRFGEQNSYFSFPMRGYSIALDFPITKKSLLLMETLDEITLRYGGRFYLAKDSRMKRDVFQRSDNRLSDFLKLRKNKLAKSFSSVQSSRLGL